MAEQEFRERLERDILGVLIWDAPALLRSSARLTTEDFADPRHRAIFEAMTRLQEQGRPLDPTVVATELARTGSLTAAGGEDYVSALHADPRSLDANISHLRNEVVRLRIGALSVRSRPCRPTATPRLPRSWPRSADACPRSRAMS